MRKLRPLALLVLALALSGCANLRDWSEIFENLNRTLLPLTVLIKSSAAPAATPAADDLAQVSRVQARRIGATGEAAREQVSSSPI
jgi:hypothetical protein